MNEDMKDTFETIGIVTVLTVAASAIWLAVLGLDHLLFGGC